MFVLFSALFVVAIVRPAQFSVFPRRITIFQSTTVSITHISIRRAPYYSFRMKIIFIFRLNLINPWLGWFSSIENSIAGQTNNSHRNVVELSVICVGLLQLNENPAEAQKRRVLCQTVWYVTNPSTGQWRPEKHEKSKKLIFTCSEPANFSKNNFDIKFNSKSRLWRISNGDSH